MDMIEERKICHGNLKAGLIRTYLLIVDFSREIRPTMKIERNQLLSADLR